MGVPKFYRFLIDRYPCITRTIKQHEIPTFDNLYVDVNSIIHACSHPTDADVYFRIGKKEFSDEEIFENVTRYVDLVFHIIKPLQMMFLAFDGVTPRAKMNQQRANRFRVSKKLNESEATNGESFDEELLDTNCITPGTVFMGELIEHVRHFVAYKVSTDPMWKKCRIVLSGPEVPGEGEHKIMHYIRYKKAQPNYNVNTRHCVYSLDADMIVLGLCCHEIHFSLIQETVRFGKRKMLLTPEESSFHLLHLCILREYLEQEFKCLFDAAKIKQQFDLELLIDDILLIGFLVGNDFIPQLPNFHITSGALQFLWKAYVKVFPNLGGYINESGKLNLNRFEQFIKYLSQSEEQLLKPDSNKTVCSTDYKALEDVEIVKNENHLEILKLKDLKLNDSSSSAKMEYYKTKLKVETFKESDVGTMVEEYVKAVQWTLNYYYQGCASWTWYYGYHYAPCLSDIKNLKNMSFNFELGKPFLPLEHLLAVLPPLSNHLLPKPYQSLVTSKSSLIIEYYPSDFETDLNGKSNDWEAVVILPFVDEKKLLKAIETCSKKLSTKDRNRNKIGQTCVFTYSEKSLGQYPVDTIYDNFENHAQLAYVDPENVLVPNDKLVKGLSRNVDINARFPGFPLMKHRLLSSFSIVLKEKKTVPPTRVESMLLTLRPKPDINIDVIAKDLLQTTVCINWPYYEKAYVIGVTDFKSEIFLVDYWKKSDENNVKRIELTETNSKNLKGERAKITNRYRNEMGINIGETKVLVYVFPSLGNRHVCDNRGIVKCHEKWSPELELHPYQLIEKNVKQLEELVLYKSVKDIFTPLAVCFLIGHPHYGAMGTVTNINTGQQVVTVSLAVSNEPDFTLIDKKILAIKDTYVDSNVVAKKLRVSSTLINRITGSIMVKESLDMTKSVNIGLQMKSSKYNKELYGYTRGSNGVWFYSDKAVKLVEEYMEKFPHLFEKLIKYISIDVFTISDLFPEDPSKINPILSWIAERTAEYPMFRECSTKNFDTRAIKMLEKFAKNFYIEYKTMDKTVSYATLYIPGTTTGLVSPDLKADHKLLDRVICVKDNFTVPLGLKGTIIGIVEKENKLKNVYEVLFDCPFTGGLSLYGSSENMCYRVTTADFINITHGQRIARRNPKANESNKSKVNLNNQTLTNNNNKKPESTTSKVQNESQKNRAQPSKKNVQNTLVKKGSGQKRNNTYNKNNTKIVTISK